jgi:hypothetical protein
MAAITDLVKPPENEAGIELRFIANWFENVLVRWMRA